MSKMTSLATYVQKNIDKKRLARSSSPAPRRPPSDPEDPLAELRESRNRIFDSDMEESLPAMTAEEAQRAWMGTQPSCGSPGGPGPSPAAQAREPASQAVVLVTDPKSDDSPLTPSKRARLADHVEHRLLPADGGEQQRTAELETCQLEEAKRQTDLAQLREEMKASLRDELREDLRKEVVRELKDKGMLVPPKKTGKGGGGADARDRPPPQQPRADSVKDADSKPAPRTGGKSHAKKNGDKSGADHGPGPKGGGSNNPINENKLLLKSLEVVFRELRQLAHAQDRVFLLPKSHTLVQRLLQSKTDWESKRKMGTPHPEGALKRALVPWLVLYMLTEVRDHPDTWGAMFPEAVAAIPTAIPIRDAIGGSNKVVNKIAAFLLLKEIKDDRVLLILRSGGGFLVPPFWPMRLDADFIVKTLTEILGEWLVDSAAPRGPLERAVQRALQPSKERSTQ